MKAMMRLIATVAIEPGFINARRRTAGCGAAADAVTIVRTSAQWGQRAIARSIEYSMTHHLGGSKEQ
jgi:hypothetical protein